MSKIEIVKVMIFDDKECYKDKLEFLKGVNKIMKRSFQECKTLGGFEVSKNLEVIFYFLKDEEYYVISESDAVENQVNWGQNIDNLFRQEEGYLVLCDYQWQKTDSDINNRIYEAVKNNPKVVFVAYTSIMFPEAQQWIDKLLGDEHECNIVDILLSIPSDNMSGALRSLEEAMWDEW